MVEIFHFEGVSNDGAEFFERTNVPAAHGLCERVAGRCSFGGSGNYGAARNIGCKLVQQRIARPAADDVNHLELTAGERLKCFQHFFISNGQAVQDDAGDGRNIGGHGLAGFLDNSP